MTIEEALISALDYEHRVRDHYAHAVERTDDPKGKLVFGALAIEEQDHVDYLESRLIIWRKAERLDIEVIKSTLPDRNWIARGKAMMHRVALERDYSTEIRMLKDALKLEREVSDHYRKLAESLEGEIQGMFQRFLEIEDAHTALVRAEIDALEKHGFWFDITEFAKELGNTQQHEHDLPLD